MPCSGRKTHAMWNIIALGNHTLQWTILLALKSSSIAKFPLWTYHATWAFCWHNLFHFFSTNRHPTFWLLRYHNHRCFHGFASQENLLKHAENCIRFKVQGVKFPKEEKLFFNSFKKMVQAPVYIVAGENNKHGLRRNEWQPLNDR